MKNAEFLYGICCLIHSGCDWGRTCKRCGRMDVEHLLEIFHTKCNHYESIWVPLDYRPPQWRSESWEFFPSTSDGVSNRFQKVENLPSSKSKWSFTYFLCVYSSYRISSFVQQFQHHDIDLTSAVTTVSIGMTNLLIYCYFGKLASERLLLFEDVWLRLRYEVVRTTGWSWSEKMFRFDDCKYAKATRLPWIWSHPVEFGNVHQSKFISLGLFRLAILIFVACLLRLVFALFSAIQIGNHLLYGNKNNHIEVMELYWRCPWLAYGKIS